MAEYLLVCVFVTLPGRSFACPLEVLVKINLTLTLLLCLPLPALAQRPLAHPIQDSAFQQLAEVAGSQAGDDFGASVAVSGDTLVVGLPFSSAACENCGAVYVYLAANGDWGNLTQVATLTPPTGKGTGGGFGYPVAVSGDTIVVGGFDASSQEAAAYVYVNPSGNPAPAGELTTSVGTGDSVQGLGIEGGTIVVGIPTASVGARGEGAAFVYVEPSTGWTDMTETAELLSTAPNTFFGQSVAISGHNIVVGAFEVKVGGVEQGAAYLFVQPAAGWSGIWSPTTEFEASNGTRKAGFGTSVSVSGETAAVGAPDEAVGSSQNEGAAYIFSRPSSGWPKTMTETAELTASGAKAGSELGFSVALSRQTMVAGAPFEHGVQGLAYLFSEPTGGWQSSSRAEAIAASDGTANDNFGYSVFIGDGVIAVGSPGWPRGSLAKDGAGYVFGKSQ